MLEQLTQHFQGMACLPVEEVHVWFVGGNGTITNHWIAARGDDTGATVSLRELFRQAWLHSAESMLVAHNHPRGDPTPTEEDYDFTSRVEKYCKMCEIALIDHVVVGNGCYYSILGRSLTRLEK